MDHPDDRPDVDFVVTGFDPDADEDLQLPEMREWPRLRRARVPLAIAAVVGIAIAAVVTVDNDQPRVAPAAAASPTTVTPSLSVATPSGAVTAPYVPIRGRSSLLFPAVRVAGGQHQVVQIGLIPSGPDFSTTDVRAVEYCPRTISCRTSSRTPSALHAALRRHFPRVHAIRTTSVLAHRDASGTTLWARHVTARSGSVTLAILVRQPTKYDSTTAVQMAVTGSTSKEILAVAGGLVVALEATGPHRELPTLAQLRHLAHDGGLLVRT